MRLLFVADGRSPIAINWIRYFVEAGFEVHLVSTFSCEPSLNLASLSIIPVAFSKFKSGEAGNTNLGKMSGLGWGSATVGLRTALRQWLGPVTLPHAAQILRGAINRIKPDLVHAMRIPYEGMLASIAAAPIPLLISVWGNDFTLHAPSTPLMAHYTRFTLERASALHADCKRDVRLARAWGLPQERRAIVLPGGGGVQLDLFFPLEGPGESLPVESSSGTLGLVALPELPAGPPVVIQPRGFRTYIRNEAFFQAIPLVLKRQEEALFLCPGMAGDRRALTWIQELRIGSNVKLLPSQSRLQMAELFRRSQVTVSPSTHDGTPNTLLEALACGCFPVAGDLESLREWITPGLNGLLVDPRDPRALAQAMVTAIEQPELRARAREINTRLVASRADYRRVMSQAAQFYRELAG